MLVYAIDGQVDNVDALVALTKQFTHTTRIFPFGIGSGVSEHLIRAVAAAGNGTAEFLTNGEAMAPKVLRQLARAIQPALSNVTINWQPLAATYSSETDKKSGASSSSASSFKCVQIPSRAPSFFGHHRYHVFAMISPEHVANMFTDKCTITCQATSNRDVEGSDQVYIRVPIDFKQSPLSSTPLLSQLPPPPVTD